MKKTEQKKSIISRLKSLDGHLHKVIEMVESDRYCMDVLQQTTAIKNALKQVEIVLLDGHLNSCVLHDIKKGKGKSVDELLELFKKVNK